MQYRRESEEVMMSGCLPCTSFIPARYDSSTSTPKSPIRTTVAGSASSKSGLFFFLDRTTSSLAGNPAAGEIFHFRFFSGVTSRESAQCDRECTLKHRPPLSSVITAGAKPPRHARRISRRRVAPALPQSHAIASKYSFVYCLDKKFAPRALRPPG
jgi:hypothetical protein